MDNWFIGFPILGFVVQYNHYAERFGSISSFRWRKISLVEIGNSKSESFNYVDRFIECRNAGLASLIELDSTDPENQMAQIGNHLKSTIQEYFLYELRG